MKPSPPQFQRPRRSLLIPVTIVSTTFLILFFQTLSLGGELTFAESLEAFYTDNVRTIDYEVASFDEQKRTVVSLKESYKYVYPTTGQAHLQCVGSEQYFTESGDLGKKGKILKHELLGRGLSTTMKHLFFRNKFPGMTENICPRFNDFTDNEKMNFWIWWFASTAFDESTCGKTGYNPDDPQGTSVGELGIPASWDEREWRGVREGAGGCDAKNPAVYPAGTKKGQSIRWRMADLKNNLVCGVEILAGVLCGFYIEPAEECNTHAVRPYGHGFWAGIKDNGVWNSSLQKDIVDEIERFPLCR